ncbi:MAG: hypothetical protein M1833_006201 [Piccolia ochrophora]|nr:MAG: hypothetical protein M1833_006201 [Piccolia ochrophora]
MSLTSWALPSLSRLLPLPESDLQQIIDYSLTLSSQDTADHLKNLLGDSPQALEFITTFNTRRPSSRSSQSSTSRDLAFASGQRSASSTQPSRSATSHRTSSQSTASTSNVPSLSSTPAARQNLPPPPSSNSKIKKPLAASGHLISDLKASSSAASSRSSSPAKVSITGGTSMHGQSTVLNDLDGAIRSLEIATNPSLRKPCKCYATRHPLLTSAPNCLHCGKIICVKEGLGPCTFCGKPLLAPNEIQAMIKSLREERGREKMAANNAAQRRPGASSPARPSTPSSSTATADPSLAAAQQHRDKLLAYQSTSAQRTRVHDESADYETPSAGSPWASPQERALQLKRQQKVLRDQEWNAKPAYEKRRPIVSIDLVGGKVVKRMGNAERPVSSESESEDEGLPTPAADTGSALQAGGAFSRNPLLGKLIRPRYHVGDDGATPEKGEKAERAKPWRRVQDENEDNEEVILDGGVYGGRERQAFG